jgi:hypothetical protein
MSWIPNFRCAKLEQQPTFRSDLCDRRKKPSTNSFPVRLNNETRCFGLFFAHNWNALFCNLLKRHLLQFYNLKNYGFIIISESSFKTQIIILDVVFSLFVMNFYCFILNNASNSCESFLPQSFD